MQLALPVDRAGVGIARKTSGYLAMAEKLRSQGIGVKVLAGAGAQIDTTSANGQLTFVIFAGGTESS